MKRKAASTRTHCPLLLLPNNSTRHRIKRERGSSCSFQEVWVALIHTSSHSTNLHWPIHTLAMLINNSCGVLPVSTKQIAVWCHQLSSRLHRERERSVLGASFQEEWVVLIQTSSCIYIGQVNNNKLRVLPVSHNK